MSRENVELIRALYPAPDTDLVALFRDPQRFGALREALSSVITEDFESVAVLLGQNRTYAGIDGLRQNWLDWLEPWATYRTTVDELIDAGERVVLLLRDYGRREGSDREVEVIGASICTIRDGKLARWEDYPDRDAALAAAGLSG